MSNNTHAILPNTTANWHWKNKNVSSWAHAWFQNELVTLVLDDGIAVTNVSEVQGDVELGQRKSKLITIFDCHVALDWEAKASDGTQLKGSLTIPEVSHEVVVDKLSDYVYQWSLKTPRSPAVDEMYKTVRSKLPVALETKFAEFPVVLVETHAKDLIIVGSNDPSRSPTPAAQASASPSTTATATSTSTPVTKKVESAKPKSVNTRMVSTESNFMASADDLFSILTDEKRIPTWSRAPAKSTPQAETEYSLFGGGVKGKYLTLTPGKEIVQTWSLSSPTWPSGHFATLTITFEQGSDSTKMIMKLDGVPTGMEDEIKRNLEGYYIHGLKSIGYVQVVYQPSSSSSTTSSSSPTSSSSSKPTQQSKSKETSKTNTAVVILFTTLVLAVALGVPFFSSSPPPPPSPLRP